MKNKCVTAALFCLALTAQTHAQESGDVGSGYSYTYVDGRYASFDNDGVDGDGFRFRGAYELESNLFVTGSLGLFEADDSDADLTVLSIGGGYYHPYIEGIDLVGIVELIRAEADANGNSNDETGFSLAGGLRASILPQLEGRAFLNYVDVADSDTYISFEGDYWITEQLSAGIGLDIGGDSDEIRFGARWSF
jgi:hypothetical protein